MNQLRRQSPSGSRCPMAVYAGPNDEARTSGYTGYRPRRTGTTRRRTRKGFRRHPWAIGGSFQSVGPDHVARSLDLQYKRLKPNSRSNADHFQIFSENRGTAHAGAILRRPNDTRFPRKLLTIGGIEGSKRLMGGSVVEAEELHHLRGRKG